MAIFFIFSFLKWQFFVYFKHEVKREEKAEKGAGQEKVDPNLKRTNENQTFH